jgi:outer membrane protein OmpA-like peptidoglycan-associated protein
LQVGEVHGSKMKKLFACTALCAVASAGAALAQSTTSPSQTPWWQDGYIQGNIGSPVGGLTRFSGEAVGDATAVSKPFSTHADLHPGYFGSLAVGRAFGGGLVSLELEGVYTNNLTKALSINNFALANHLRVESLNGFGNIKLATPAAPLFGHFTVAPYIAGGAGYGGSRYADGGFGRTERGGFAYQGKAGFDIHTGTPWTIDVGYRYLNTAQVDESTAFEHTRFNTAEHIASIGLRYSFGAPPPAPTPAPPPPAPPPGPPPPPPAPLPPPPPEAPKVQNFVVYFPFDRSTLTADAQAVVQQAAAATQQGPVSIAVVGHTDTSGSVAYNLRLSERRAKAVADALVGLGVAQSTLNVSWVGKTDLAVPTPDGVKEPLNRRATITLTPASS